jgi:hypothetical protein
MIIYLSDELRVEADKSLKRSIIKQIPLTNADKSVLMGKEVKLISFCLNIHNMNSALNSQDIAIWSFKNDVLVFPYSYKLSSVWI